MAKEFNLDKKIKEWVKIKPNTSPETKLTITKMKEFIKKGVKNNG